MKVPCDPVYNALEMEKSHKGGETHPKSRETKIVPWNKEEDLDLRWWVFFIWGSEEPIEVYVTLQFKEYGCDAEMFKRIDLATYVTKVHLSFRSKVLRELNS